MLRTDSGLGVGVRNDTGVVDSEDAGIFPAIPVDSPVGGNERRVIDSLPGVGLSASGPTASEFRIGMRSGFGEELRRGTSLSTTIRRGEICCSLNMPAKVGETMGVALGVAPGVIPAAVVVLAAETTVGDIDPEPDIEGDGETRI